MEIEKEDPVELGHINFILKQQLDKKHIYKCNS